MLNTPTFDTDMQRQTLDKRIFFKRDNVRDCASPRALLQRSAFEERRLYITLGVLLMLWGFALASVERPTFMDYSDAIGCLCVGAMITWNGFQSLFKERAVPYSAFRRGLLLVLIAAVCGFLALRILG